MGVLGRGGNKVQISGKSREKKMEIPIYKNWVLFVGIGSGFSKSRKNVENGSKCIFTLCRFIGNSEWDTNNEM